MGLVDLPQLLVCIVTRLQEAIARRHPGFVITGNHRVDRQVGAGHQFRWNDRRFQDIPFLIKPPGGRFDIAVTGAKSLLEGVYENSEVLVLRGRSRSAAQ